MLDLRFIRENPDAVRRGAQLKNIPIDLDKLLDLDARRREAQTKLQELVTEQNKLSKEMGPLMGRLKKEADPAKKAELEKQVEALRRGPRRSSRRPPGWRNNSRLSIRRSRRCC